MPSSLFLILIFLQRQVQIFSYSLICRCSMTVTYVAHWQTQVSAAQCLYVKPYNVWIHKVSLYNLITCVHLLNYFYYSCSCAFITFFFNHIHWLTYSLITFHASTDRLVYFCLAVFSHYVLRRQTPWYWRRFWPQFSTSGLDSSRKESFIIKISLDIMLCCCKQITNKANPIRLSHTEHLYFFIFLFYE